MARSQLFTPLSIMLCAALGCADSKSPAPQTALIVEVHTDLELGEEIDEIRVLAGATVADGGASDAGTQMASGELDAGDELPVQVVLQAAGGASSVRVIAEGYRRGERVRVQTRRTEFVRDEVRVLRMELSRVCALECADEGETCIARGAIPSCESEYLPPQYLLRPGEQDAGAGEYDAGPVDAGRDGEVDAAVCVARSETCNGEDDDCDERVDEGSTLCPQNIPFAVQACGEVAGTTRCHVVECTAGRLDCDDEPDCEAKIDAEHCGDCETVCDNGDVCAAGGPTGYQCLDANQCPGTTEVCDATCVDKARSTEHCGDCGNACASLPNAVPACDGGECVLSCAEGYRSCNGDAPDEDGCETDILTDPMHCGGCEGASTRCPSRPNGITFCDDGICGFRCEDGFLNCNDSMADGCETPVGDDDCYACDNACNGLLEQCCENQRDCCVL